MIRVMQAEKLRECLSGLRDVVNHYEMGRIDFVDLALEWLQQAEILLREERLPEASEVVTARTNIFAAGDRSQIKGSTGASKRREKALAAVDAVCLTEEILRQRLLVNEGVIDEYEDKLVEAVTGLIVLGAMPPMGGMTRQAWATHVWTALASEKATRPTAVWISAALAPPDRMSLLYRILQRFYTSELPVLMEMPQMHAADETEHSPS